MRKFVLPRLLAVLSCCLSLGVFFAIDTQAAFKTGDLSDFPEEYGKVVYTKEGEGRKQVYIIFQAHRSSVTGLNNRATAEAQSDIYRIQEWLVRNEDVQLLLPEGFFRKSARSKSNIKSASAHEAEISVYPLEDDDLMRLLSDTSEFVSADKLLYQHSNIRLQQIENRELYFEVYRCLSGTRWSSDPSASTRLGFLQSKRNAHLLQKLPEVIEEEYETGRIGSRKAIFTIGLAHAPDIIRFVEEQRIAGRFIESGGSGEKHELKLAKNGYHITMIIPRALIAVSDQLALNMTGSGGDRQAY